MGIEVCVDFVFNAPERYWCVLNGYHIHKPVWGLLLIVIGLILLALGSTSVGITIFVFGVVITVIGVVGQEHTPGGEYRILFVDSYFDAAAEFANDNDMAV